MNKHGLMGQYAGFVSRALGLILDIIIVIILTAVLYLSITLPFKFFLSIDPTSCATSQAKIPFVDTALLCNLIVMVNALVSVLVAPVYFIFLVTIGGQTIGHYVAGVRVVRIDGQRMTIWRSFLRWVGLLVDLIALGIGFLWVLIDDRRQGWHDKMAGTVVLYAWEAEQNEFLLDRVTLMLNKGRNAWAKLRKHNPEPTKVASGPPKNYDLVTIAFQDYGRMDSILNQIQTEVVRGKISIVNATVLAKGPQGDVGVVGISDLATGSQISQNAGHLDIPDYEVGFIMQDVANDSFVIAVVLEEQWADQLTKIVARSTQSVIRRYDLGDAPAPERAALTAAPPNPARSVMARPAAAPLTTAASPAPSVNLTSSGTASAPPPISAATPSPAAPPTTPPAAVPMATPSRVVAAPKTASTVASSPPASAPTTPTPTSTPPAPAKPSNGHADIVWPDLHADAVTTPAPAASPAVAPAGGPAARPAVTSLAGPAGGTTAASAGVPDSAPTSALAVAPAVQQPPAHLVLEGTVEPAQTAPAPEDDVVVEEVQVIIAQRASITWTETVSNAAAAMATPLTFKAQARLAASQYGYAGRTTACVQELAEAKHIGETYQQRLYRAGVGTFWELAHVSDAEFEQFLKFGELQKQTINCSDIRKDGLRLALASDTIGLLWDGETPDSFEPFAGIGRVFEQKLYQAGIYTFEALAAATPETLAAICPAPKGLEPDYASWIEQAKARQRTNGQGDPTR